ncbi:sulfate transporter 2.1-like [Glycine max]|uniref:sulfate transporter 2.1-like n=1 Tax=Glycine max TaxID=3847 RepID=UPI00071908A0|nr:sulfate transporter 2.1-like [Glycine max]|eukprot:XP_014623121.1 sulfate transporter 2.1-like [Glycine max]
MGTSREIAIGPVAVVSLLLSSMMEKLVDPATDPVGYTKLILLATLFAGIFQTSFGLLRLGFLVDFLSHAAIVGFVAGAAIVIGLQQLKGLLGITNFSTKTDIVSVMKAIWEAVHNLGKRKKKLFWLASISPLVSVVVSTLIVFITRADKNGVKIVKHVKGGLNPRSIHQLDFNNPYIGEVAKIGLVVAVVALTGTQRFLQLLELYASVVMGLEAHALVNGQNLAITYNVFLGNHTIFETEPFLDVMVKAELLSESTAFHVQSLDSVHMNF